MQNYLDSHPWRKRNTLSRPKEVSGFGRGTGNGGGDPGYSREHSGRRGQFGKERSKDEWKGKDGRSHKKDSSDVIPICHECGVWEVAVAKEGKAKDKMAHKSARNAKLRHFSRGDQVLVRVVDPGGKLGDRWDEVESKVADVTYRLAVPHINRLKPWNAPDASVLRVVVADEEVATERAEPDWRTLLDPQQRADVERILVEYKDQTDGSFGEGVGLVHDINTEGHDPSWTHPHRIAPAWREPLKEEVKSLLEKGIVRPSNSPWSSSCPR